MQDVERIDCIIAESRYRKDLGDIDELASRIEAHGLYHPIVIDQNNKLLAGYRRLVAVKKLGWNEIPVTRINPDNPLIVEHDENVFRKPFTVSELVAIAREIEARDYANRQGKRTDLELQVIRPEVRKGIQTRDLVAEKVGFSSGTILERAEAIVDNGIPELIEAVDQGEISISKGAEIAKKAKTEQKKNIANVKNMAYIGSKPGEQRDSDSWYTPEKYVEAARLVLGEISLDPLSSKEANKIIKAKKFYSLEDDAFKLDWCCKTLWMNPPYGRNLIDKSISKFLFEHEKQKFDAIVITNNATETSWFQSLLRKSKAICLVKGRIEFISPDEKRLSGNTRGQIFFYFGKNYRAFKKMFGGFGEVCRHG